MGRVCDGKKRYETRLEAIHYGLNHTKTKGGAVRVYHCPICHGYHLTTRSEDGQNLKNKFLRNGEAEKRNRNTDAVDNTAL